MKSDRQTNIVFWGEKMIQASCWQHVYWLEIILDSPVCLGDFLIFTTASTGCFVLTALTFRQDPSPCEFPYCCQLDASLFVHCKFRCCHALHTVERLLQDQCGCKRCLQLIFLCFGNNPKVKEWHHLMSIFHFVSHVAGSVAAGSGSRPICVFSKSHSFIEDYISSVSCNVSRHKSNRLVIFFWDRLYVIIVYALPPLNNWSDFTLACNHSIYCVYTKDPSFVYFAGWSR